MKENKEVYEDPKEISEVLNKNFQKVFTQKNPNLKNTREKRKNEMWEIKMNKEEIKEMMKKLDEKKAIGPDGVSRYILKQCRQEMAEPIHDTIECSLRTGKVPRVQKS